VQKEYSWTACLIPEDGLHITRCKNSHLFLVNNFPAMLGCLLLVRKIVGSVFTSVNISVA
jgi:hypothetical protein